MHDLCSADPTQEVLSLDHAGHAAPPTRQRDELDHADQESIYLPWKVCDDLSVFFFLLAPPHPIYDIFPSFFSPS